MNNKEQKLLNFILNEIKNSDEVAKLNYKELGDYLIQKFWANQEWGSYDECVLNRVIKILFELDEDYGKEKYFGETLDEI